MLTTIMKFLFIYFFCIIIFQKSLNIFKISLIRNFSISLILAIIVYLIGKNTVIFDYIIPWLALWIIASILTSQPQLSFVSITISFTISFCIHAIASFLVLFVFAILRKLEYYPLLALITGIIQLLMIKGLFSIKRFRKGIPYLSSSTFINIATILCLFFIGFTIYVTLDYKSIPLQLLGLCSFIVSLAFLIYWWQAQITKSYRRSLELRELESIRTADLEKDILIQKLLKENDRLATITHRDNTLITTLKNSTVQYLSTDFEDSSEAKAVRDKLIADIEALSAGRTSLPPDYNEKKARDFETGFSMMNKILHQMDENAIKLDITFSVHVGVMLGDFVPKDISEMDLVHLVDDLLKNAFKATRNSASRMVQLQFYKVGKHFVVEVADSGIPFEVKSLVNMGITKLTTYEDGSGIGLMDIWNTKENYRATYHIEEYATPAPFTKKISLTFDGKNRYSIRTSRKDEILQMSKRADLQVYGYEE